MNSEDNDGAFGPGGGQLMDRPKSEIQPRYLKSGFYD